MIQGKSYGFKHLSVPRLPTNESYVLTHILILRVISSKLHTVKPHIHYESLPQYRLKYMLRLKALYATTSMNA